MNHLQSLTEILALQDKFNSKVNPKWRSANYKFYRAAYFEIVEFAEHVNSWKWWKANNPGPYEQCLLELVDTFHFVLSDAIIHNRDAHTILGSYNKALRRQHKELKPENLYNDIDDFVELTLALARTDSGIPLVEFFNVVLSFGATLDELIKGYIEKNVLNFFRQNHGYKEGTYVKSWDEAGNEDNHYLALFVEQLEEDGQQVSFDSLTKLLEEKYATLTA